MTAILRKVMFEGQACLSCGTAVVKKQRRPPAKTQEVYYEYYLKCPGVGCGTSYLVDGARRFQKVEKPSPSKLFEMGRGVKRTEAQERYHRNWWKRYWAIEMESMEHSMWRDG